MTDHIDTRFNKLESKIDELTGVVVGLARMEERITSLLHLQHTYDQRQQKMGERIGQVFDRVVELEKTSMAARVVERVLYIIITAGAASLFWYMQQ